jgi:SAM-dependent methyltransferase
MSSIGRFTGIPHYLAHHGLTGFAKELQFRLTNRFLDAVLNVQTHGELTTQELGMHRPDYNGYQTIGYSAISNALRSVPIEPARISLLDIGCGMGRPMIVAARLGCRSIRGIDIAPLLTNVADRNTRQLRTRPEILQIITGDATSYDIPGDVNVIFMANPLAGDALATVGSNIRASYTRKPRPMFLVYFNAYWFDRYLDGAPGGFLIRQQGTYYPGNFRWAIYEVTTSLRPQPPR